MASLWNEKTQHLLCYVGGGVLTMTILVTAVKKLAKMRAAQRRAKRRSNYPANTVILHQISRGSFAPSMSPFPLKLETYLRMAKIPYQNEHGREMSSKSKTPWITYNGEDMADSQFIIDFLSKKLEKNMNSHLSKEQRAIARAFQKMTEENLFWTIAIQRWIYNIDNWESLRRGLFPTLNPTMARYILGSFVGYAKKMFHAQGMGRHTQEEVYAIARGDMEAISDFLDFPNLSAYCDRMKDRFWPDWDECNTANGTRKAPK